MFNRSKQGLLLVSMLFTFAVHAESPEQKGLEIAKTADQRNQGWVDSTADLKMILRNKNGDESIRSLKIKSLEGTDDGDKSLTLFEEPKDVRGTALLTYTHKTEPDDQWLYLPALRRVKRIASRNKSGPFMGSEFAFEDFSSQEVEKYKYKYLKDEPCGKLTCFVLERFPVDEDSGYTRQIAWIDQKDYRIQKVDYYDRKNSLLKTLTASGYKEYLNKYWRPSTNKMVNHQTGKSTDLIWSNYHFKTGLTEQNFSKNSLKRSH